MVLSPLLHGRTGTDISSAMRQVWGFGMFYGGLVQLLVGMWEVKRNNVFGATAFTSYGAFWMSLAFYGTIKAIGSFSGLVEGEQMMLVLWGILTYIFFIGSLRLNVGLMTLFLSLGTLFMLLAAGHPEPNGLTLKVLLPTTAPSLPMTNDLTTPCMCARP